MYLKTVCAECRTGLNVLKRQGPTDKYLVDPLVPYNTKVDLIN